MKAKSDSQLLYNFEAIKGASSRCEFIDLHREVVAQSKSEGVMKMFALLYSMDHL